MMEPKEGMRTTIRKIRYFSSTAWPWAILAVIPLGLLGRAVLGLTFLGSGDALVYYFPVRYLWTQAIAQGSFPLWTELLYSGYPLAADIQTAAFYPLNLIHLFLSPLAGHNATVILHTFLAGFFTYGLALHHGMERRAALMAGIIFTLPGCSFSHMGFYPFSASLTWMPAVLLTVMRYLQRPSVRRGAAASLTWAVQVLAGFPQLVVYTGLAAGVLTVFHIITSKGRSWRVIGGVGCIGFAAIGLSALQIIPTAEMVRLGPRTRISYENFALGSLNPAHLPASLISPGAMSVAAGSSGDWSAAMYGIYFVGVFPFVALAYVLAMKPWKSHREQIFSGSGPPSPLPSARASWLPWACMALIFALMATGGRTPLGIILYHLPVVNLFQVQARFLAVAGLALAILTGFALDHILQRTAARGEKTRRWTPAVMILGLAVISIALRFPERGIWEKAVYNNFGAIRSITPVEVAAEGLLLLALAGITAAVIHVAPRLGQAAGTTLLTAGIVLPLAAFTPLGILSVPGTTVRQLLNNRPPTIQAMEADSGKGLSEGRVCTLSDFLFLSSASWTEEYAHLALPDLNVLYGVRQIGLYGPLQHNTYNRFIGRMANNATYPDNLFLSQWVADVLGIRFILARSGFPWQPDPSRHTKIYDDGRVAVFRNERAMPLAWLVPMTISDEPIWNGEMPRLEPHSVAPVRASSAVSRQESESLRAGEWVNVIESGDGRLEMDARLERPRFLAVSLRHYPGWRVHVDGEEQSPVRAYGFLMGTFLAPGRHFVVFDFHPASFLIGAAISALTAAILLGLLFWETKNTTRRPQGIREST